MILQLKLFKLRLADLISDDTGVDEDDSVEQSKKTDDDLAAFSLIASKLITFHSGWHR